MTESQCLSRCVVYWGCDATLLSHRWLAVTRWGRTQQSLISLKEEASLRSTSGTSNMSQTPPLMLPFPFLSFATRGWPDGWVESPPFTSVVKKSCHCHFIECLFTVLHWDKTALVSQVASWVWKWLCVFESVFLSVFHPLPAWPLTLRLTFIQSHSVYPQRVLTWVMCSVWEYSGCKWW